MRLFLDANVLFAACWSPDGRAGLLVQLARAGHVELLTSPYALEETRRNLERKRPHALTTFEGLRDVVQTVSESAPMLLAWATDLGLPVKDAPILAAAVAGKADALVTGDIAHFGHLYAKKHENVLIQGLQDALAQVMREARAPEPTAEA